jgi:hypothetical protein
MPSPLYDILRKDSHGAPVWLETVAGVQAAKARTLHLAERFPADYLIFHQGSARIVATFHFKSGQFTPPAESPSSHAPTHIKTLNTA